MRLTRRAFFTATGLGAALAFGSTARAVGSLPAGAISLARHVLNRCSFGPRRGDLEDMVALGVDAWLEAQLHPEDLDDGLCERRTRRLETLQCPAGELFEYKEEVLWKELATGKLLRALYSERQLYEVMVDFWTDHFNIDISKGDCPWLKTADDREVIRKHALGSFPELLRASALGPAMLWYLDGRTNQRKSPEEVPNENYARELLELHTLGVRGGYSQADVMEAARCLTGWTVRTDTWFGKGQVEFNPGLHDDGAKHVLGEEIPGGLGEGDVDELLRIVCARSGTARHLAQKLCHRFIGIDAPEVVIAEVAGAFSASGGDIRHTLTALFKSDAFRNPTAPKFKRPFNFLVSALRASSAEVHQCDALLDYLARMGHSPFQYPTPDGYPEEAEPWYGSMLWRWHFVYALSRNEVPGVTVDWPELEKEAGGAKALIAGLLGRSPDADELNLAQKGSVPALVLASPDFQGC